MITFAGPSTTSTSKQKSNDKKKPEKPSEKDNDKSKSPGNTYLREERLYKLLTSRRCVVYALFLNNGI